MKPRQIRVGVACLLCAASALMAFGCAAAPDINEPASTASDTSEMPSGETVIVTEGTVVPEENDQRPAAEDLAFTLMEDEDAYEVAVGTATDATQVVIPETFEGKPVTHIAEAGFRNCEALTAITIPMGVTKIDEIAFQNCKSLKSVLLPTSVTRLDVAAFYGCSALEDMVIPAGVTLIDEWNFAECTSLKTVTLPAGITEIATGAFLQCTDLSTITFLGTQAQWEAIGKTEGWDEGTGDYVVVCSDGTLPKDAS